MAQDTAHTQHNAPREHTGEEEPTRPRHRTHNKTHRAGMQVNSSQVARDTGTRNTGQQAGTPVNRSQVAQDAAHATKQTERARL